MRVSQTHLRPAYALLTSGEKPLSHLDNGLLLDNLSAQPLRQLSRIQALALGVQWRCILQTTTATDACGEERKRPVS